MTTDHDQPTLADGLRALADLLDEHPDLAPSKYQTFTLYRFANDADQWQNLLRQLGTFEKRSDSAFLNAERTFGNVKLQVTISKEKTCERHRVGTRMVQQEVYPDDVKPEIKMVEEPIYEWTCPDTWIDRDAEVGE